MWHNDCYVTFYLIVFVQNSLSFDKFCPHVHYVLGLSTNWSSQNLVWGQNAIAIAVKSPNQVLKQFGEKLLQICTVAISIRTWVRQYIMMSDLKS